MASETLYTPKGAGHKPPEERREYTKPEDRIMEAFYSWLQASIEYTNSLRHEKMYEKALECVNGMGGIGLDGAYALLQVFEDHPLIEDSGIFISAIYNTSPDKELVFDPATEKPTSGVGFRLGRDKRLIIRSHADRPGFESKGTILNLNELDDFWAQGSRGVNIGFGSRPSEGIVTVSRDWVKYAPDQEPNLRCIALNRDVFSLVPGLREYVDGLMEKMSPERQDSELFREMDQVRIENTVRDLIKAATDPSITNTIRDIMSGSRRLEYDG